MRALPSRDHSTKSASSAGCGKVAPALAPGPLWISEFSLQTATKQRADERTRTADLLITSELLYQLSYVGLFRAQSIPQDLVEGHGYPQLTELAKRKIPGEIFRLSGMEATRQRLARAS
jgi:hypothetical protein